MKIAVGCDHAGFSLKQEVLEMLEAIGPHGRRLRDALDDAVRLSGLRAEGRRSGPLGRLRPRRRRVRQRRRGLGRGEQGAGRARRALPRHVLGAAGRRGRRHERRVSRARGSSARCSPRRCSRRSSARSSRASSGTSGGSARSGRSRRTPGRASSMPTKGETHERQSPEAARGARPERLVRLHPPRPLPERRAREPDPRGRAGGDDLEPDDLPEGDRRLRTSTTRTSSGSAAGGKERRGRSSKGLAVRDVQGAADVFRPVFDADRRQRRLRLDRGAARPRARHGGHDRRGATALDVAATARTSW